MMDIIGISERYARDAVEIRRRLHRNPELSDREFQTLEFIGMKLAEYGIEHIEVERGGILGFIGRHHENANVLLRADIDALPIRENPRNLKRERAVISQNDGVQHACGHDAHTAMLLTAARILKENEGELNGGAIALFERGEEGTGNLRHLLRHIIGNGIGISAAHAIHVRPDISAGELMILDGPVMAGTAGFEATVRGRGGHSSRPDRANSPIDCFVAVYEALSAFRLRRVSPFEPFTFSIGRLSSGEKGNIIPAELTFTGSARFYNIAVGELFAAEFKNILENVSRAYGCECLTKDVRLVYPTVNHSGLSEFTREAARNRLGASVLSDGEPLMGSESFSAVARLWPSVLAYLGVRNDEFGSGAELHSEYFDIDEDALRTGIAETVTFACEYLSASPRLERAGAPDIDDVLSRIGGTGL
ncbi:MAG: amidohydrolase [Oscillospiraceae bacterium]|jgi:amidohydrolase|nr:amidohydrolase [Oscillospiraceae bacterium]